MDQERQDVHGPWDTYMNLGWGLWLAQTEVCQNQLAKIGMLFTKERKRGRAGMVIKRAGPSMKESKKSKVSMSEEQQCWGWKALYLGDERKLQERPDAVGVEPRIH